MIRHDEWIRRSIAPEGALRNAGWLAAVVVIGLACRGGEDAADADEAATSLHGEVELAIGEVDGAEEYTFARIGGLAVDSGGRMFVVDNDAHTVRVFAPDGKFRYAIGRRGQGPGELMEPCCPALRGDTLWVRDGGNARYDVYTVGDTAATYLTGVRMAHRDANRWAPVTFDPSGNVIDIGSAPVDAGAAPSPTTEYVLTRFHLDRTGRIVAQEPVPAPPDDSTPVLKVTGKIPGGVMTRYLYAPYPPFALRAHSPLGEQARAVSSRYSIAWLSPDGTLLRTITGSVEPPALSASEVARAESSLVKDMKWIEAGSSKSPFTVPARKQPLRDMYFDLDGRLWVELSVAQGAARKADVYDRTGRRAFTVEWPRNVDLAGGVIRGTTAYGVLTDSLDVQHVARLRLK